MIQHLSDLSNTANISRSVLSFGPECTQQGKYQNKKRSLKNFAIWLHCCTQAKITHQFEMLRTSGFNVTINPTSLVQVNKPVSNHIQYRLYYTLEISKMNKFSKLISENFYIRCLCNKLIINILLLILIQ